MGRSLTSPRQLRRDTIFTRCVAPRCTQNEIQQFIHCGWPAPIARLPACRTSLLSVANSARVESWLVRCLIRYPRPLTIVRLDTVLLHPRPQQFKNFLNVTIVRRPCRTI